jgi:hypothetical protein
LLRTNSCKSYPITALLILPRCFLHSELGKAAGLCKSQFSYVEELNKRVALKLKKKKRENKPNPKFVDRKK